MDVVKIQYRLNQLGFWPAGIKFSNNYGSVTKDSIKKYQQKNNLSADGIAGPKTVYALFKDSDIGQLIDLVISQKSVDLTLYFESGNTYDPTPEWPEGISGITVGHGYDLGYNTQAQIKADWSDLVDVSILMLMQSVAGLKGQNAKAKLSLFKKVQIPKSAADQVFLERTLFRFGRQAYDTFPGLDKLNPDAAGSIVQAVFNRGTSLDGTNRVEMLNLVPCVANNDLIGIANQLKNMTRLWDGIKSNGEIKYYKGLVTRYTTFSNLVRQSIGKEFKSSDLVHLYI